MDPDVYANLIEVLRTDLSKKHTNFRRPISAEIRLALTLRYLALGDCFRSLSQQFRVGLSTTRLIIRETCKVIIKTLQNRYLSTPRTRNEWEKIADDFNNKWHFPHCIGAVDGKHIRIVQPLNTGTFFYNYKGYFSTVLLGIADADYKFLYVSIGAEGKASDGGIWNKCTFYEYLSDTNNPLNIPEACAINGIPFNIPYFLVGDEAFRLGPHLMKKFPGIGSTRIQKIYNYRLSRCRRIIENTFGILTCRFRIFRRTIEVNPDFVDDLVMACCILHNYLRVHARNEYIPLIAVDHEMEDGTFVPGAWRQEGNLDNLMRNTQKNATEYAKRVRNSLSDYFVSVEGQIPWQYRKAHE
jgi:hypothetical protein